MAESKQYLLPNTQGRYVTVTVTDTSGEVYRVNDDGSKTIYADYSVENGKTILEASTFSSQEFQRNLAQSSQGYNRTISNSILEASGQTISQQNSNQSTVDSGSVAINENPNQSPTASNAGGDLRYPLNNDGSYDFLLITTYKYVNAGPGAAGRLLSDRGFDVGDVDSRLTRSEGPTIALPMHPGISDSNSVDWGADQLNPLQLVGARAAAAGMKGLSELKPGEAAAEVFAVLRTAAGAAMNDIDVTDITAFFAGQAVGANIFTRSTGKVINPNLELLFRGPQLRTFNYNYKFTPRSDAEAKTIRSIIRHFKKNMAVKKSNGGLFLETPNVFGLKYIYAGGDQHPFLNKIKKCALTNFNVDYTPDGSYTTYKDGSMTSYSVTMQFSELNPIYEDDYEESTDMGY